MEETNSNIELFDSYIRGELSESEKESFDKKLSEDPELKADFEIYLSIVKGIKAASEDYLREKFKEIDLQEKTLLSGRKLSTYLAIAAAIVLFVVVGISVIIKIQQTQKHKEFLAQEQQTDSNLISPKDTSQSANKPVEPQKPAGERMKLLAMNAYNDYYTQYPNKVFPKSRGEIPVDSFERAMYYYDQQDYLKAEELLKNLKDIKEAQFYYAMTLLSLDKNKSALSLLLKLQAEPTFKFYYPSIWYAGMACLKLENIEQAILEFKKLTVEKNPYSAQAESILKILEQ